MAYAFQNSNKNFVNMPRHHVGKMDTNTLLLIGAGAVAVILLMKKSAVASTTPSYLPASYLQSGATSAAQQTVAEQQTVQTAITTGGDALQTLMNDLLT